MYFRVQTSSTISMCEIFVGWNVFVRLYAFRSKDHISMEIVGVRVDVRAVELECFCVAEIDCVVAKNNEAVEGHIRRTGRNQHLHNTASRD